MYYVGWLLQEIHCMFPYASKIQLNESIIVNLEWNESRFFSLIFENHFIFCMLYNVQYNFNLAVYWYFLQLVVHFCLFFHCSTRISVLRLAIPYQTEQLKKSLQEIIKDFFSGRRKGRGIKNVLIYNVLVCICTHALCLRFFQDKIKSKFSEKFELY